MRRLLTNVSAVAIALALASCQSPVVRQVSSATPTNTVTPEAVRETLSKRLPGTAITEVNRTEADGVYEVVAGRNVFYTDSQVRYMFVGSMYDITNRHDVTADRMAMLSRIKFAIMPEEAAIVIRQGSGTNKVAVFSDPDCPYCRKLEPELAKLKDTTIYVYLMPLPMHSDAAHKAAAVWCSADRGQAWRNLMLKDQVPVASATCEQPLKQILSLAQGNGVLGTPTLISADGRVHVGFMPADKIEQWIKNTGGKS